MPEQQQETQEELMERIKKMSPEELLEFQKSRCVFCHIINGKVQSKKIYEDNKVCAILDINPANPGHILLMPKEHYSIMPQVPKEVLEHLFIVCKKLCQIALQALKAKGTNIIVQNGIAAGQKAQHFMLHIIPRKEEDGLGLNPEKKGINENDYMTIKDRLTKRINEIFGIKQPEKEIKNNAENNDDNVIETEDSDINSIQESKVENTKQQQQIGKIEREKNQEYKEKIEEKIQNSEKKFITSSTAKRYHIEKCPFAQNIQPHRRILITEKEAESSERKPCTCVTGEKIPLKNQDKTLQEIEKANNELDNLNEDIENLKANDNKKNKEVGINLDDISRLIGK